MSCATANHYATLQVAFDATPEEVRRAYRQAAQRHHPDRQPDDASAQERMAQINEAYAVLSHPQRRASYDLWVRAVAARARAQAAAQAARPSRFSASWPWGLIAATMAFAFLTIGTVVYKTAAPTVAASPKPAPQIAQR